MMEYKGYVGDARVDPEAGVIRGQVVNTRDMITFQGATVPEALAAFRESVDDYLEFCATRGESPDKPFSGKFIVRLSPTSHRALALEALRRGVSLNKLAGSALIKLVRSSSRQVAATLAREPGAGTARPSGGDMHVFRDAQTGKLKQFGTRVHPKSTKAAPAETSGPGISRPEEAAKAPADR